MYYPKPEYWQNLIVALKNGDTNDKQKLNVMRLASAVNVLKRADDYKEIAQIAMDEGLPAKRRRCSNRHSRRSCSPISARSI